MNSTDSSKLYDAVFRALLTEETLDAVGRISRHQLGVDDPEIIQSLGIENLDDEHVATARRMSYVYTAIAAFENSVRELISKRLLDEIGEDWWQQGVSKSIREYAEKRMSEEQAIRWHTQRGDAPINFTTLKHLLSILRQNPEHFAPFIPNIEWAEGIFAAIERSRNVIMHSGTLDQEDIERLGIYLRDWTKQVPT